MKLHVILFLFCIFNTEINAECEINTEEPTKLTNDFVYLTNEIFKDITTAAASTYEKISRRNIKDTHKIKPCKNFTLVVKYRNNILDNINKIFGYQEKVLNTKLDRIINRTKTLDNSQEISNTELVRQCTVTCNSERALARVVKNLAVLITQTKGNNDEGTNTYNTALKKLISLVTRQAFSTAKDNLNISLTSYLNDNQKCCKPLDKLLDTYEQNKLANTLNEARDDKNGRFQNEGKNLDDLVQLHQDPYKISNPLKTFAEKFVNNSIENINSKLDDIIQNISGKITPKTLKMLGKNIKLNLSKEISDLSDSIKQNGTVFANDHQKLLQNISEEISSQNCNTFSLKTIQDNFYKVLNSYIDNLEESLTYFLGGSVDKTINSIASKIGDGLTLETVKSDLKNLQNSLTADLSNVVIRFTDFINYIFDVVVYSEH